MTDVTPVRIGGDQVTTDDEIVISSPYDGHEVGRVPACGKPEVDRAVAAARSRLLAAADGSGEFTAAERAAVLDRAAALLDERADQFARIIAEEAAKPLRTALVEARRAVDTFRFSAAEARTLAGDVVPLEASAPGAGKIGFTLRVPIGVVGAISPFNFPLNLVAHKVAPAIAAGCPVVLKPASQTPLSALALAALLLDECGLPAGWLNVVTGSGRAVGDPLVDHDDVAMITFTGSPEVGWGIRARAARKKVNLELGNNTPVIVEGDADWRTAAAKLKVAGLLARRPVVHLVAAALRPPVDRRRLRGRARRRGRRAGRRGSRSTRPPTCRRSSPRRDRAGVRLDRRGRGGRRQGGDRRRGR